MHRSLACMVCTCSERLCFSLYRIVATLFAGLLASVTRSMCYMVVCRRCE